MTSFAHPPLTCAETDVGTVIGRRDGPAHVFMGVPYAAPPIGRRRFAAPEQPEPWAGERMCITPGPIAPQPLTPVDQLIGAAGLPQSEDCLNLNIWTPGLEGSRAIMVWLHGGSFSMGTGAAPVFDGTAVCTAHDVVVVTLNYRLGLLGFLPAVGEGLGASYRGAANAGLLDVVAALEWIARNAAAFGGDPANVTLMGESAGGTLAALATALAAPRGLVRRYVVQSSGFHVVHSSDEADRIGRQALALLGVDRNSLQRLFELPIDAFFEAQAALGADFMATLIEADYAFAGRTPVQPAIDGAVLTEDPHRLVAQLSADIELLVGVNRDEMAFTAQYWPNFLDLSETDLERRATAIFSALGPEGARSALHAYRSARPGAGPSEIWLAIQNDAWLNIPSRRLAKAHPGPVYAYLFSFPSTIEGGRLGAYHGMELPFPWNNLDTDAARQLVGEITPEARELASVMSGAWAAFARDGAPAHAALPHWPKWSRPENSTMELGATCRVIHAPHEAERQVWDALDRIASFAPWIAAAPRV